MSSIDSILRRYLIDPAISQNVSAWEKIPASKGSYEPFPENIHPTLLHSLKSLNVSALYTHQKLAWDWVQNNHNVVIATSAASGKTLCYNLPVIDYLLRNPNARALYLYPTKALAHDQLDKLKDILASPNTSIESIQPSTYDGDTSQKTRPVIRENSRLILSNPDMLHASILPSHPQWAIFFQNLHFLIIDEMHTYRGVFGSHVANVIRRLKRVTQYYGSSIQFILTSATIGNPIKLAEELIAAPVQLIDIDGSERGEKHFLIYNPPLVNQDLGLRASLTQECIKLAQVAYQNEVQTIIFGRTRRAVEILLTNLRSTLEACTIIDRKKSRIRAYRSGYLPNKRRIIEKELRHKQVILIIATTALELGIDIGYLDLVILAGYPGTVAATWQQAGRSGRRQESSVAILVASPSLIDQYLANNPQFFFLQTPEEARINPNNLLIVLEHIKCALFEIPFNIGENYGNLDIKTTQQFLDFLYDNGILYKSDHQYYWMSDQNPALSISLRSITASRFLLQDISKTPVKTIGEVDKESVYWMVHQQAIYLHEGETYLVTNLDSEAHTAYLQPVQVDYYTRPIQESKIDIIGPIIEERVTCGTKVYGEISVTSQVIGFEKIQSSNHEVLGFYDLTLPSSNLQTFAYWFKVDHEAVSQLRDQGLWNNDPNIYGATWRTQREKALRRDQYACQLCGLALEKTSLHVHHLAPFKTFKNETEANTLSNLTTLCASCHRKVENRFRIRSGFAGFSYILRNLAPLYAMCDIRDLGVYFEPRSTLNASNPIVVLYDQIPGGIGFSLSVYQNHNKLIREANDLTKKCRCTDGCPSCVGPGGEFGYGSKEETIALLNLLNSGSSPA